MTDYEEMAGKRVVLILVDEETSVISSAIPGLAALDEENEMFQLYPDDKTILEEDCSSFGISYKAFDDEIATKLNEGSKLREQFNCDYMILLK